ncbi:MAG: H-X9-DG-CTERM domain-containing protein, partial [Phycisphaerae bacterium]
RIVPPSSCNKSFNFWPWEIYVTGATNWGDSVPTTGGDMQRWCLARHGNGINMSFMDGHVQYVEDKKLWNLNWAEGWVANPPASVSQLP